ncbi:MAG: single-stranded-DNA-specific exonuclease RecJ [Pseudomonadota bacterium]
MLDEPAFLGVARSATGRRWVGPGAAVERVGLAIAQAADLPEIVGRVLALRGVAPPEAGDYLAPRLRDLMPDPSRLAGMDAAAERLARAARGGERVAVFGDYDVDGAASAALLGDWLAPFGIEATLYIPDRLSEGYGPNTPAMDRLGGAHDLVLCVDCGTVSHGPVAAAAAAGADVLVIDHHLAGETLPEAATAVVNPNRHDCAAGLGQLCAAGVVFLLLVAANRILRAEGRAVPDLMEALDLVAVATVADMAPLTGLNRAFVRQGLSVLAGRRRPGLAALADVAGLRAPPTSSDLGFAIGPRINAGGRVGEASLGVRLLTARDAETATGIAARLDALNAERRQIEAGVLAVAMAEAEARLDRGRAPSLAWAAGQGWHAGVVGIVASRLKERFGCPAVVIGLDGEEGKGSGRSVPGVDLGSAVAALASEGVLLAGGGHAMAAGLSVSAAAVEPAMAALEARLAAAASSAGLGGTGAAAGPEALAVDGALAPGGATTDLVCLLERAGPFGQANPAPRLGFAAVRAEGVRVSDRGHASFRLRGAGSAGARLDAIAFGAGESGLAELLLARAATGAPLHLAGRLVLDDWGGRRRAKLRLDDAADPA